MNAGSEPTIYLVDDDDAVRDSLKTLLESYGMRIREHGSAEDFLQTLEPHETGCLILDLHLPILGGLDLIRIMRQRKIRLPVVFITGRSDKETKARAMEAGAIAFLEKPVTEEPLMLAIATALAAGAEGPSSKGAGANASAVAQHPVRAPS